MNFQYVVFLLHFLFLFPVLILGNDINQSTGKNITFQNYNIEDGLVSGTVTCVYQDHQGFIWVGTDNGLSRFNGHEFENFREDPNDPDALYSDRITDIYEDSHHRLWIGTNASLERFNRRKECFIEKFPVSEQSKLYVEKFYEDSKGNFWAVTASEGLLQYNDKKDSFESSAVNSWRPDLITGINDIVEDDLGRLWLATEDSGVYCIDLSKKGIEHFMYRPGNKNSISGNSVHAIDRDSSGNLWMATYGNGICKYNPKKNELIRYQSSPDPGSLSGNLVLSLLVDSDNRLWVTSESGLDRFFPETQTFQNYHHIEGEPCSLANNKIWTIYEDRNRNLWLGHYLEGLSFTDYNNKKPFYTILKDEQNPALNNNYVNAITETSSGNLLIGTDGGGINLYDTSSGDIKYFRYSTNTQSTNVVLSLLAHSNEKIYIGTYLDGLWCYDPKTQKTKSYKHPAKASFSGRNNDIRDMDEDAKGNIWIATHGDGVHVFNPEEEQYINHFGEYQSNSENTLCSNWLNAIHVDPGGKIWMGSLAGLIRFDPETRRMQHYCRGGYKGLSSKRIHTISEDKKGRLLVGTDRGLNIHHARNDSFVCLSESNGLAHDVVNSITTDDQNNYWIGTFNGLSRYDPRRKQFINFYEQDGLSGSQFLNGATYQASSGKVYLGTTQGLTYFSPGDITIDSADVPVRFTEFKIFNHEVKAGRMMDGVKVLSKDISVTDTARIHYHHSMFSIGFAALDYTSPEKNRYKYKLEGFDKSWIYPHADDRMATYTNLEPGKYTFKVLASNNDGIWNSTPETLVVEVIPPFWMELWFKLLAVLTGLLLLISAYFYRVGKIKRLNRKLAHEVVSRTSEIRSKNEQLQEQTRELHRINAALQQHHKEIEKQDDALRKQRNQLKEANKELERLNATKDKFFSIIGHDLKSPISNILGFSSLYKRKYSRLDEKSKYQYIDHIHFSSRQAHNLLENLLTWARNQQGRIEYNPVAISFRQIVSDSLNLIYEKAMEKKLNVSDHSLPELEVYGDYNMIYTILRNLLSNAVKFTPKGGTITIETNIKNEKEVLVAITDTGIGMPAEVRAHLFSLQKNVTKKGTSGERGSGLGLLICKEFLERHGRELYVESKEGEGTSFSFVLPLVNHKV